MFINNHSQVIRESDGSIAIIRMRMNGDYLPDSTHWYTSRLIYRDQDCPNSTYKEKNVLSNIATLDAPLEANHLGNIMNEFLETDPTYFEQVRTIFKENEHVNPATCPPLVFAILEGRSLCHQELEYIASGLRVDVAEFYQDIDALSEQLKAEFEDIDAQYTQYMPDGDLDEYNNHFSKLYESTREKYDVLRPYYYKNKHHPFLNIYRNIVYNKLIEQQLFQIVWVKPEPQQLFDQDKNWIHIGSQKIRLDGDTVAYYEHVEYNYHKSDNSMFQLYPDYAVNTANDF